MLSVEPATFTQIKPQRLPPPHDFHTFYRSEKTEENSCACALGQGRLTAGLHAIKLKTIATVIYQSGLPASFETGKSDKLHRNKDNEQTHTHARKCPSVLKRAQVFTFPIIHRFHFCSSVQRKAGSQNTYKLSENRSGCLKGTPRHPESSGADTKTTIPIILRQLYTKTNPQDTAYSN